MFKSIQGHRTATAQQGHQGQPHGCGYVVRQLSPASTLDQACFTLTTPPRRLLQTFAASVLRNFLNTSMKILLASSDPPVPAPTLTQSWNSCSSLSLTPQVYFKFASMSPSQPSFCSANKLNSSGLHWQDKLLTPWSPWQPVPEYVSLTAPELTQQYPALQANQWCLHNDVRTF